MGFPSAAWPHMAHLHWSHDSSALGSGPGSIPTGHPVQQFWDAQQTPGVSSYQLLQSMDRKGPHSTGKQHPRWPRATLCCSAAFKLQETIWNFFTLYPQALPKLGDVSNSAVSFQPFIFQTKPSFSLHLQWNTCSPLLWGPWQDQAPAVVRSNPRPGPPCWQEIWPQSGTGLKRSRVGFLLGACSRASHQLLW